MLRSFLLLTTTILWVLPRCIENLKKWSARRFERIETMNYTICKTDYDGVMQLFREYQKTLSGVCDEFWETHILRSDFYTITIEGDPAGYFAVYEKTKLTQFFLSDEYLNLAQAVFERLLAEYSIQTAFVATCDELFLSLCMDCHKKIEMQAYFFDGSVPWDVRLPEFGRACLLPVSPEELTEVKAVSDDFFEEVSEDDLLRKRTMLYRLSKGSETLGFGILVPGILLTQYASIGMITLEPYRRRGVGRSILLHLADLCRENGLLPIAGCWYGNRNSKRTLESAGFSSKTRLLNVSFS